MTPFTRPVLFYIELLSKNIPVVFLVEPTKVTVKAITAQ